MVSRARRAVSCRQGRVRRLPGEAGVRRVRPRPRGRPRRYLGRGQRAGAEGDEAGGGVTVRCRSEPSSTGDLTPGGVRCGGMTVAIVVKVFDGLVLAADSATTLDL